MSEVELYFKTVFPGVMLRQGEAADGGAVSYLWQGGLVDDK
ncbi:MAG: hypothetical protein NTZ33_11170 [Bacteroidetes bacterium]|nr:hypothetical protein [Bacteroidota bacterium]